MLRFFKADHHFPFMKWSKWTIWISVLLGVMSLALFFTTGPNYGVDFKGGTEIKIEVPDTTKVADVRTILASFLTGELNVKTESGGGANMQAMKIRLGATGEAAAMDENEISALKANISSKVEGSKVLGVTSIGGTVSSELVTKGLTAIGLTLLAIGFYIWLQFEWQFSLGAILSLFHDVTLTIGIFCILPLTFDLSVVAAILALIGYSLNDTVVVYDRIREKLRDSNEEKVESVIDRAINETLRRTTMTSFTTIIAILALIIFGGSELRGFSVTMLWGVMVGTFSSIFVASPILTMIGLDRGDKPKASTKFADIDA